MQHANKNSAHDMLKQILDDSSYVVRVLSSNVFRNCASLAADAISCVVWQNDPLCFRPAQHQSVINSRITVP